MFYTGLYLEIWLSFLSASFLVEESENIHAHHIV